MTAAGWGPASSVSPPDWWLRVRWPGRLLPCRDPTPAPKRLQEDTEELLNPHCSWADAGSGDLRARLGERRGLCPAPRNLHAAQPPDPSRDRAAAGSGGDRSSRWWQGTAGLLELVGVFTTHMPRLLPERAGLSAARWYCYSSGQFSVFGFCKTILSKISPWRCWLCSRLEIAFSCLKFLLEFQMENVQLHFPS